MLLKVCSGERRMDAFHEFKNRAHASARRRLVAKALQPRVPIGTGLQLAVLACLLLLRVEDGTIADESHEPIANRCLVQV